VASARLSTPAPAAAGADGQAHGIGLAHGVDDVAALVHKLDIPPITFVQRLREVVPITDLYVGLVKAPVFAAIIAIAGCYQGMQVESDAEQVGTRTTTAVVQAIFLVIVLDAFFAVFFTEVGWN